jgi:hypothetical protein
MALVGPTAETFFMPVPNGDFSKALDETIARVLECLPVEHRPVLHEARAAYLGLGVDYLAIRQDQIAAQAQAGK